MVNEPQDTMRSVVIEKIFTHPVEKVWRALTDQNLLTQWLLKNDFDAELGKEFQFHNEPVQGWDGLIHCKVLAVDPRKRLVYSWRAFGSETTVEFLLEPTEGGTHLRMEHSGFRADQQAAYQGATYGWQKFLSQLERLLREGGE